MESDVCKHCTHAACLDVCPTGALFRTEFGTVVVQQDICNGCGYCVPACPFGVLDRRHLAPAPDLPAFAKEDGRVWKCTLCYDRLKGGHEPACAKACPTEIDPVRPARRAAEHAPTTGSRTLEADGWNGAQLYGRDPGDGVGGFGAFFLLLDEPEVYGLPPDPVVTTRDLPEMWTNMLVAAGALVVGVAAAFAGGGRSRERALVLRPADPQGTDLDLGDPHLLLHRRARRRVVRALARGAAHRNEKLARTSLYIGAAADLVSPVLLDLRPRAAGALPPHVPRPQGHVADERRLLGAARRAAAPRHGRAARAARAAQARARSRRRSSRR